MPLSLSRPGIVWVTLSTIWGSTWVFIKVGLEDLPPFTFAGIRFAIALLPLGLYVRWRRPPIPRGGTDWWLMVQTGVLTFGVTYGLVFWGEQYISSGLAALLFATFPLFGLLIAHAMLPSERMTGAKVLGVLLGMIGVALVFSSELQATDPMAIWGSAGLVAAALSAAYADVLIKQRAGHIDPAVLTLVQMFSGVLILGALGLMVERDPSQFRWTPLAFVSLLYLGVVGSALAFVLLYWLIRHMAVTKTMLITFATPLVAVLLGIVFLGEVLTWQVAVGGMAILSGLGLTLWERKATLDRVRPGLERSDESS